jgi:hypothetical protein
VLNTTPARASPEGAKPNSAVEPQQKNRNISRKGRQENESFGAIVVCCCVMLNEVKHLLALLPKSQKQILRRYTPQNDTLTPNFRRPGFGLEKFAQAAKTCQLFV